MKVKTDISILTDYNYYSKSWHRKYGPKRTINTKWADIKYRNRLLYRIVVPERCNAQSIGEKILNANNEKEFIKYFSKIKFFIVPSEKIVISLATRQELSSVKFKDILITDSGKIRTEDEPFELNQFKFVKI